MLFQIRTRRKELPNHRSPQPLRHSPNGRNHVFVSEIPPSHRRCQSRGQIRLIEFDGDGSDYRRVLIGGHGVEDRSFPSLLSQSPVDGRQRTDGKLNFLDQVGYGGDDFGYGQRRSSICFFIVVGIVVCIVSFRLIYFTPTYDCCGLRHDDRSSCDGTGPFGGGCRRFWHGRGDVGGVRDVGRAGNGFDGWNGIVLALLCSASRSLVSSDRGGRADVKRDSDFWVMGA
mmetsp:Transcript_31593/g.63244  ORF Transcript_31593/g.63244 Transcript_31593/m.63244 type:complete len:228 (-) Transcript_31593:772-1455(-)